MITPLAVHALSLKDQGYKIKVRDGELRITKNKNVDDVKINCVYTKKEIDALLSNVKPEEKEKFFKLKESDQLYLYKPSSITQTSKYYVMSWNIDPGYDIPRQTNFAFYDYLFGHTWLLTWDGDAWIGDNVVNNSYTKITYKKIDKGRPYIYVQHTDKIAKWLKIFEEVTESSNYASLLSKYVTNWRLIYNDGSVIELNESNSDITSSSSGQTEVNEVTCDLHSYIIHITGKVSNKNLLYIMADIKINDNVIPLRWDMHPRNPIDASYINTWNEYPVIESFRYERRVRHSIKIIEPSVKKNINIYIEKEYFEQMPANADENYNPFETIIIQQYYEVRPDPRNCTTLSTDYNIYSSKIIWADNIMTMRRDLNVVGGTVDILSYDYSVLKAMIDAIQEQMRLQAAYNEYTAEIQKYMTITKNVLNIIAGAIKIATALSEFSMNSENMTLNTYRTEDFHFPGFPGGGDGFGGGDFGGKYPGKEISGQFLFNFDATAAGQVLRRFIPTETTIPAATSTLTATDLILHALNSLTNIGDTTTTLIAGGVSFERIPTIIDNTRTIFQSTQTFTDSVRELYRRWRERGNNH